MWNYRSVFSPDTSLSLSPSHSTILTFPSLAPSFVPTSLSLCLSSLLFLRSFTGFRPPPSPAPSFFLCSFTFFTPSFIASFPSLPLSLPHFLQDLLFGCTPGITQIHLGRNNFSTFPITDPSHLARINVCMYCSTTVQIQYTPYILAGTPHSC